MATRGQAAVMMRGGYYILKGQEETICSGSSSTNSTIGKLRETIIQARDQHTRACFRINLDLIRIQMSKYLESFWKKQHTQKVYQYLSGTNHKKLVNEDESISVKKRVLFYYKPRRGDPT